MRGDFPYSESASSFPLTSSLRCVCPPAELRVGMKEADKKFAARQSEIEKHNAPSNVKTFKYHLRGCDIINT